MTYEVFVRYALNAPTTWAFDFSYIMLRRAVPDVRRLCAVRATAMCAATSSIASGGRARRRRSISFSIFLFFLPGISALIYSGWNYAQMSCGSAR